MSFLQQQLLNQQDKELHAFLEDLRKKEIIDITPMGQVRARCSSDLHDGIRQFFNGQVVKYSYEKYGKIICWKCQQKMKGGEIK